MKFLFIWLALASIAFGQLAPLGTSDHNNPEYEGLGVAEPADETPDFIASFFGEDGDPSSGRQGDDIDLINWANFLSLLAGPGIDVDTTDPDNPILTVPPGGSTSTVTDNGDGTFTHDAGSGPVTWQAGWTTAASGPLGITLTYPDGSTFVIPDGGAETVTTLVATLDASNPCDPQLILTYVNEDASQAPITLSIGQDLPPHVDANFAGYSADNSIANFEAGFSGLAGATVTTYAWTSTIDGAAGPTSSAATFPVTAPVAGWHQITATLTVTDSCGESATDTTYIEAPDFLARTLTVAKNGNNAIAAAAWKLNADGSKSWDQHCPFLTVSAAVQAADVDMDVIHVHPGIYNETVDIDRNVDLQCESGTYITQIDYRTAGVVSRIDGRPDFGRILTRTNDLDVRFHLGYGGRTATGTLFSGPLNFLNTNNSKIWADWEWLDGGYRTIQTGNSGGEGGANLELFLRGGLTTNLDPRTISNVCWFYGAQPSNAIQGPSVVHFHSDCILDTASDTVELLQPTFDVRFPITVFASGNRIDCNRGVARVRTGAEFHISDFTIWQDPAAAAQRFETLSGTIVWDNVTERQIGINPISINLIDGPSRLYAEDNINIRGNVAGAGVVATGTVNTNANHH